MFNTVNTQGSHFDKGFWSTGTGAIKVLIVGSCRVLPYVNYFHYLNDGNRFTINLVNVVNFYYDRQGKELDTKTATAAFEGNPETLKMLKETNWFLHEHSENFGMMNTSRDCPKNLYQFGLNPQVDAGIPNLHCIHVMAQEYVDFDAKIKAWAKADYAARKSLSPELQAEIKKRGLERIQHFLEICQKSGVPEFGPIFEQNWRTTRYFWTGTHISNEFSIAVFRLLNDKHLHLQIPEAFWARVKKEDLYSSPRVQVTKYDVENYGLKWPQPVEPLKL